MLPVLRKEADLIYSYFDMDVRSCTFCFLFSSYLMDSASSYYILVLFSCVFTRYLSLVCHGVAYGVIWKWYLLDVLFWIYSDLSVVDG